MLSLDFGPDDIAASVVDMDGSTELGRIDGRYLSAEVASGMSGRVVGPFCTAGELEIRSFSYVGADDDALLS
jgi:xylan 1,4-beta-xylosidase